jgi:hypothetical protein
MELEAGGKTRKQVVGECWERDTVMGGLARILMDNFLGMGRVP